MMNHWCGMGRLTKDPELRTTQSGKSVASFTVAVDNGYGDNKQTAFIDCVAWEGRAETICKHLHKGSLIGIEGRIDVRNYEDKNGNKRKAVEIVVSDFHFAESKKSADPLVVLSNEAAKAGIPVSHSSEGFQEISGDDDLPF